MSNHKNPRRGQSFRRPEVSVPWRYRRGRYVSRKTSDRDARVFEHRAERRAVTVELHKQLSTP